MARSHMLKSEIARVKNKGAGLSKDLAQHREVVAKATVESRKKRAQA